LGERQGESTLSADCVGFIAVPEFALGAEGGYCLGGFASGRLGTVNQENEVSTVSHRVAVVMVDFQSE
jgi:hypothetical protein